MKTNWFWTRFLLMAGSAAITMPWQTIYCLPGREGDDTLFAHERWHLIQISRDGALTWTVKAFWYLLRYGYRNSPYEIEAREISGT